MIKSLNEQGDYAHRRAVIDAKLNQYWDTCPIALEIDNSDGVEVREFNPDTIKVLNHISDDLFWLKANSAKTHAPNGHVVTDYRYKHAGSNLADGNGAELVGESLIDLFQTNASQANSGDLQSKLFVLATAAVLSRKPETHVSRFINRKNEPCELHLSVFPLSTTSGVMPVLFGSAVTTRL